MRLRRSVGGGNADDECVYCGCRCLHRRRRGRCARLPDAGSSVAQPRSRIVTPCRLFDGVPAGSIRPNKTPTGITTSARKQSIRKTCITKISQKQSTRATRYPKNNPQNNQNNQENNQNYLQNNQAKDGPEKCITRTIPSKSSASMSSENLSHGGVTWNGCRIGGGMRLVNPMCRRCVPCVADCGLLCHRIASR